MTGEVDPDLKLFMRQRMVQLSEWREVLAHGTSEEKRVLVESLREIDLEPLLTALDEDEEVVRAEASEQRRVLAVIELQAKMEQAIREGDIDAAAAYLDLRLNATGEIE